jgi:hypothetical protein
VFSLKSYIFIIIFFYYASERAIDVFYLLVQRDLTILDWLFECINETLTSCFNNHELTKPFRNFSLSLRIVAKFMRQQAECNGVDAKLNNNNKSLIVHVLNLFSKFFNSLESAAIDAERLSLVLVTFADVIKHFKMAENENELSNELSRVVDRLIELAASNAASANAHLFDKYEIILKCSSILSEYSLK